MTPETKQKRERFQQFIQTVLASETVVKGVVAIGSMATGHMTAVSDIDAVVFLDPFDPYIIPAEAIWRLADNTFHSIFNETVDGLQVDFARLNWQQWSDPDFEWPEGRRAELSVGWIAYDPSGQVTELINQRAAYDDDLRLARLDEAIVWLDQHLNSKPELAWEKLGLAIALDRLEAAYNYLAQALFAFNRRWRPWRNREMQTLLQLPWLPDNFAERVLIAANAPSLDHDGYTARTDMLCDLFDELLSQLVANGDYSNTPIDQAFIRSSDEPGRAWNMDEWNKFRQARKLPVRNGN
ncbi:MAG: hypothetical protein GY803_20935 [Chloroflexi bacterium]|nr:hypothetical protein [Chloroflexota bacterium]